MLESPGEYTYLFFAFKNAEDYQKAQQEAREAGRGVWNPEKPLGVQPKCFREQQKGREC